MMIRNLICNDLVVFIKNPHRLLMRKDCLKLHSTIIFFSIYVWENILTFLQMLYTFNNLRSITKDKHNEISVLKLNILVFAELKNKYKIIVLTSFSQIIPLIIVFYSLKIMPPYPYPNPQQEWRILADKQYQQSKMREQQQSNMQKQLKQKYLQELSSQIKTKQRSIQFEKHIQKSVDRIQIDRSVQNQKRLIDIQQLKNSIITQKTNKVDYENFLYEKEKKEKQRQIKQLQKMIEKSKLDEAEMLINYQKEKQQRKKQYFREFLKDTMQKQKQRKNTLQQRQRQLQRAQLRQLQRIQQRSDDLRQEYLQKLKERAKKVDYGAHSAFESNKNKSLIQRKSQQWQTYKDSIQREEVLKKMQQQQRIGRKVMANYYHKQLKDQISQREADKKQKSHQQTQKDKDFMNQAERFSWMLEEQKRNVQTEKKRMLYSYLKQQEQQKGYERRNQNAMREQQLKMNLSTLNQDLHRQNNFSPAMLRDKKSYSSTIDVQNSRSNSYRPTPGDTFRIDPYRIKQLQTISKSLKPSNNFSPNQKIQIDLKSHRYFATKGLSVLN